MQLDYSNMDRDSYIGTKGAERDSDSEFENRHSKRKGISRGKITVCYFHVIFRINRFLQNLNESN